MYSDQKRKHFGWLAALLALLLALALCFGLARGHERDLSDEAAAAIRDAVERSARQCYVVEGVYPPNLQYLEENYGLQVNTRDFYVTYEAFASNLPPTVVVTAKH